MGERRVSWWWWKRNGGEGRGEVRIGRRESCRLRSGRALEGKVW